MVCWSSSCVRNSTWEGSSGPFSHHLGNLSSSTGVRVGERARLLTPMSTESTKEIVLVRHGETEWSLSGRHTSRTDVPLTARGMREAERIGVRLEGRRFALVLTSPRSRAAETCRLAGFAARAETDEDLVEWDY